MHTAMEGDMGARECNVLSIAPDWVGILPLLARKKIRHRIP